MICIKLEVLISAMHQSDMTLIEKSNINTDALIINQCDIDKVEEQNSNGWRRKMVSTTERGLSKSRNRAIREAKGDICLICDDDEKYDCEMPEKIVQVFSEHKRADIICFIVRHNTKKYPRRLKRIGIFRALRVSSCQIAFKRSRIIEKGILFNENIGSGTPLGSGEETKFLIDAIKKGLTVIYVPIEIGEVAQVSSQWFSGFDTKYFHNRGTVSVILLGSILGRLYCLYFAIAKYGLYRKESTFCSAIKCMRKGILSGTAMVKDEACKKENK